MFFSFQLSAFVPLNRVAKTIIRRALREDLGMRGDITSLATVPAEQKSSAVIIAKSPGVVAGQKIAEEVFKSLDKSIRYEAVISDGAQAEAGTVVARIKGRTQAILTGERTALNILGRCCGIATATRRYVEAVAGTGAKICETRKTAPGLRYLDKAAVVVGGGVNHRFALYDAFLIKENHVAAAGGIRKAIEACRASKTGGGRLKVMVEARDHEEFLEALRARPDRILLDNMTPEQIRECVEKSAKVRKSESARVELEATGGITLENVRSYAETGVDFISIGALTHSVKVMDLSLLLENG
jgi:nicotinate-nucleotide pyrophosphorylase (carboxylating)